MKQTTKIFSKDALFSFENAQIIVTKDLLSSYNGNVFLEIENIFRGSYAYIRESELRETFSSMLGLNKAKQLNNYYQEVYHEQLKNHTALASYGKIEINGVFNTKLLTYKNKRKTNTIDFFFLFYVSFLHLSRDSHILQMLKNDKITQKSIIEN